MKLDHSHTKVILIGNSQYADWPDGDIENIKVNLEQFNNVLIDPDFIGVTNPDNIIKLSDCKKIEIQLKVNEFTKKCLPEDNLIIYYSGHGLIDIEDPKKLYLATAETRMDEKKITCISVEDLKEPLMKCKANNRIMILDCCYAAKAVKNIMADIESLRATHWNSIEGVYFLMSSDEDEPSRFDPNDKTIPTFFTQKLIQTIKDGDEAGQEIWTLDYFFDAMKQKWDKTIAPIPIKLTFKEIGQLPFCYNRYKLKLAGNINISPEMKRWNEIELNPTDENIKKFIRECRDSQLKKNAVIYWNKMKQDWDLLAKALQEGTFEALSKFILECDPVPPVLEIALAKMQKIKSDTENRIRSFDDHGTKTKASTKPRRGQWSN